MGKRVLATRGGAGKAFSTLGEQQRKPLWPPEA